MFQFDFVNLVERPKAEEVISDDEVNKLVAWFKERENIDPLTLAQTFAGVAEYLSFRSDQLA